MDNLIKVLEQLKSIVDFSEDLRLQINFEEMVFSVELYDRSMKWLNGIVAIKHLNSYMRLFGLDHMVIAI